MYNFQFCISPTFFHFQNFLLLTPHYSSKTEQVPCSPCKPVTCLFNSWVSPKVKHMTQAGDTLGSLHRDGKRSRERCSLIWRLWAARTYESGKADAYLPFHMEKVCQSTQNQHRWKQRGERERKERWCLLCGYFGTIVWRSTYSFFQTLELMVIIYFLKGFNFVWVSLS